MDQDFQKDRAGHDARALLRSFANGNAPDASLTVAFDNRVIAVPFRNELFAQANENAGKLEDAVSNLATQRLEAQAG
jgi:hypothetical protein